MKVKQVIDTILNEFGGPKFDQTVDTLICGNPETEVSGIVTTFMATVDVIKKAAAVGANMIITHEPTYFTGYDQKDWLINDEVFIKKQKLIDDNKIAIWRFHDHMHAAGSDKIYDGLIKELHWEKYIDRSYPQPHCYNIPEMSLRELSEFFKVRLNVKSIQIVGSPETKCRRVGILVGGGSLGLGVEEMPMELMRNQNLDVIVCGEITEWTLSAYVRDASQLSFNRAMLVIGHERSEEPGMKYMAEWLPALVDTPVVFIDSEEPFSYL